jgi:hypothetical protein
LFIFIFEANWLSIEGASPPSIQTQGASQGRSTVVKIDIQFMGLIV